MTLDEAIKHADEVAEENQRVVDTGIVFDDVTIDMLYCDDTEVIEEHLANYQRCAEEHRQLAEWLKDYKRLLEQESYDDEEYKKDLNDLKEEILEEGNTLVSKRDLLERFDEIDKEYEGRPWNLLQILANINILIGQKSCDNVVSLSAYEQVSWERDVAIAQLKELGYGLGEKIKTCEDAVSRKAVLDMAKSYNTDGWDMYTPLVVDVEDIEDLPSVKPTHITCNRCKYWEKPKDERLGVCTRRYPTFYSSEDYFCGDAERRTDGEN